MTDHYTFHEISSLQDRLYDSWLDLYQVAFPLSEQMLISEHNRSLRDRGDGGPSDEHYLAILDDQSALIGLARYDVLPSCEVGALWYLAVLPDQRSRGVGSKLYTEIVRRLREASPVLGLFYEVELPGETHSAEERALADRRIAFYRRNGARVLDGIRYVQSVGWQPAVPMGLMVHPFQAMDASEAFERAKCVFGDALRQEGSLALA